MDAALLWLRLLATSLIKSCDLKRRKADSYIFYKKDGDGKLELVMSVHVDGVYMARKPETLKKIK